VRAVGSLPAHLLLLLGTPHHGFAPAFAARRAAGDPLLRLLERPLGIALVPRVGGGVPLGGDEKDFPPHVDAGLPPRERQGLDGTIRTRP